MSKGKDLGLERGSTSNALPGGGKQRENDSEHGLRSYSEVNPNFNWLNPYRVFDRDRLN